MKARALRAVLLVLGAVLIVATAIQAWPSGTSSDEGPVEGQLTPLPGAIVEQEPGGVVTDLEGSDVHGPPDSGWRRVALGFAFDFTNQDGGHTGWHRRIKRWTTPALAGAFERTNGRLLPTGPPVSAQVTAEGLGLVEVVVDFPHRVRVGLRLVHEEPHGWVVTAVVDA